MGVFVAMNVIFLFPEVLNLSHLLGFSLA